MLLVNGAQGIGTGWSTFSPSYDPRELVRIIRGKLLRGMEEEREGRGNAKQKQLVPYVRGFRGTITPSSSPASGPPTKFLTTGIATKTSRNTVTITELPVGKWNQDYKVQLLRMQERGEIKSFKDLSTTKSVRSERKPGEERSE